MFCLDLISGQVQCASLDCNRQYSYCNTCKGCNHQRFTLLLQPTMNSFFSSSSSSFSASSSTTEMVIIVKTSADASDRRDAICATWARREELEWEEEEDEDGEERSWQRPSRRWRFFRLRVLFLLGRPAPGLELEADVQREARDYDDILMWDFQDSYRNLTIKSILGIQWVARHFGGGGRGEVKYVVSMDHDVYFHPQNLMKFLRTQKSNFTIGGTAAWFGVIWSVIHN